MKLWTVLLGAMALLSSPAYAQSGCSGQPNSGYVCGNGQSTAGLPGFYPQSTLLDKGFGSGTGTVLNRGLSGWVATVAPALGVNGGTGGSLVLNGGTSGSATISVPAAAGSVLFQLPATNGSNNQVLTTDGSGHLTWQALAGTGTVTSVGLSMPGIFSVSGSPVTSSGTLMAALATELSNTVWAGPTTGAASAPTFRTLVGADLPNPTTSSLGGVQANNAVSHQWLNAINTSGVPQLSQPTFSDISGTMAPTQCPTPTVSTIGCVQAINATASQWLRALSTSGIFTASQPNFSDLAGNASLPQLPGIGNNTVLGNNSGGTATPLALTASNVLDMIGTTQGSVLYRGASSWTALSPGSSGQVLSSNGAAANPSWATISGTGTVTSITAGTGITLSPSPITTTGSVSLASISNGTVLANVSGSSAAPSGTTPSAVLDVVGSTQGSVLYRGASTWAALTPGTSGQFLQTQGAGSTPAWASAVTNVTIAAGTGIGVTGTCNISTSGTCTIANTGPTAAFYAEKLGTNQTGLTNNDYTTVTWPSTFFNTGGFFDTTNNWWTPPAGIVKLEAYIWQTSDAASSGNATFVTKILRTHPGIGISQASPAVVNWPAHNMIVGQPFQPVCSVSCPSPITSVTVYCVKSVIDANNFTIAAIVGASCAPAGLGAAINTTTAGSGTFTGFNDTCAGVGTAAVAFPGTAIASVNCTAISNGTDHYIVNYFSNAADGLNNGVIDGNPAHTFYSGHIIN